MKKQKQYSDMIGNQLVGQFYDQLLGRVWDQTRSHLWLKLGEEVGDRYQKKIEKQLKRLKTIKIKEVISSVSYRNPKYENILKI